MISLYDILEAADGQLFGEAAAQIFSDFCFDVRQIQAGQLFVALKTDRGDGHHNMAEAAASGATGIMCTHPPDFDTEGLTVIVMRSVEDALMRWSRIVLQKFGTTVIGVTGGEGKTTTIAAIEQVLKTRFRVYTHPGGGSGKFGLPLALGKLTKDHQIAVLELSPGQVGEMAEMVDAVKPMVGVVITAGQAEITARENEILVRALPPEGAAILNFNDPLVRELAALSRAPVITVGLDIADPAFGADLLAYNILVDRDKTGFDLRRGSDRFAGRWVPLLGAHQLYSALVALAVGSSYQISLEEGLHALTELPPLPGRMCALEGINGSLLVDDSFSATLASTRAALDWLKTVRSESGQVIMVLGDMDELGSYGPLAHLEIGQRAAGIAQRLVTQGDRAAEAGRAAVEHGLDRSVVTLTFNAEDAANAARAGIGPQDIVLVKGGTALRMERTVQRLMANPAETGLLARTVEIQAVSSESHRHPSWVQIDLEAIAYNVQRMKEIIGPDVALMAIVKANAYGHGAVQVSMTALNNGATMLGVAALDEALELRAAAIDAPILILGYTPAWVARDVIRHNLTITLYDVEMARAFDRAARELDATIRAHVLVDTGLGMLGLLPDDAMMFFRSLRNLKNLQIEGIYSELAAADQNAEYTRLQVAAFEHVVEPLLATGFRFKYIHTGNSASTIHVPESRFNMVRIGIALYGLAPGFYMPIPADFRPAMTWKTAIAQVKRLPPGSSVGSGSAYRTSSTQLIAVIPVGYSDGFRRTPMRWKHVLIQGEFVPILGQVGMDMTAVDVTQLPDVKIGEEVVLIGAQGNNRIMIEDVADFLDTNMYEVISTVLPRVTRGK